MRPPFFLQRASQGSRSSTVDFAERTNQPSTSAHLRSKLTQQLYIRFLNRFLDLLNYTRGLRFTPDSQFREDGQQTSRNPFRDTTNRPPNHTSSRCLLPMAAAPQAFPVHVTKNAEGDFLLTLPENHPAVLTTRSFVLWIVEDGSASIHMHLAILLFSSRCTFSAVPSHQAFFKGVSVLTFNLTEGAWCKVLSMLGTAGVFNEPDLSRKSYIKTMMAADIAVERTNSTS